MTATDILEHLPQALKNDREDADEKHYEPPVLL